MKISIELLVRELKDAVRNISIKIAENSEIEKMGFSSVQTLGITTNFKTDILYLVDLSGLSDNSLVIKDIKCIGGTICYLGNEADIAQYNISYICCCKDDSSLYTKDRNTSYEFYKEIYDILSNIFQKYKNWQQGLFTALQENDLQAMLKLSFPIFNVSLLVHNIEFNILALSSPESSISIDNKLPISFINLLKINSLEMNIYELKSAYLAPNPVDYCSDESLAYNIFLMNNYFGRIIAVDTIESHQFTKSEHELMNILGYCIQLVISQNYNNLIYLQPKNSLFSNMKTVLQRLINDEKVERTEITNALTENGWNPEENYYIGYLYLNQKNSVPVKNSTYYCKYIIQHFSGIYAVEQNGFIVLLIKNSLYHNLEDFISEFIVFVRDGDFRLGLSNLCKDLTQLYHHYRQAEIAFTYGVQNTNDSLCYKFSNYTLKYIIQQSTSEIPAEFLCAEELLTLKHYDQCKHTDYFLTLKTYLDNQMNASQTAKKLYIHYATLVYRLNRIKEMVNLDIKNTERILYIQFSYEILDMSTPHLKELENTLF